MQPKKTKLEQTPRACPRCGLPAARLKRQDHYLSLFFIPLIPVKRGEAYLECDQCGAITVRNGNCYLCHNCGNSMGCS